MSSSTHKITLPALQQWYERGEMLNLCGHDIFCIDEGDRDAPVLLLIHGFPTASWDWDKVWSTLREQYRIVCLDMLGFGFSDKPNARNYSIHGQADIVEALVNRLELDKFHVLAHDYGVSVAQELLARQNEGEGAGRWLSICFLNGGLFPETHRALLTQKLLLSPLGGLVNSLFGKAKFDKSFSSVFGADTQPSAAELEGFWALINYKDGKHLFHNLITYMSDRKQHRQRWLDALVNASVPVGLINGSVDPVSGSHMVVRFKELQCRLDYLAELPTIGHYPQVEDPEAVAQHYLHFLGTLSPATEAAN